MPTTNPYAVTTQPINYEVLNTFGMMGNEKISSQWSYDEKKCLQSYIQQNTLTDTRLLIQNESNNCFKQAYQTNESIFLRDIAQIRRTTQFHENGGWCVCCCSVRDDDIFELKGIFGKILLYIPEEKFKYLLIEIPTLAGNQKLVIHH